MMLPIDLNPNRRVELAKPSYHLEMGRLRSAARVAWYVYSLLSIFFIAVIIVDLLLIWGLGFSNGVIIYVNKQGEGFSEQLQILSVVPWIAVTAIRTLEDAVKLEKPKVRLTKEEWTVFKEWLAQTQAVRRSQERMRSETDGPPSAPQTEPEKLEEKKDHVGAA